MIERVEIFIRRLRNYFSRSRLLVRLFGLSRFDERAFRKGLVMIQIDALSRKQLEKAITAGEVPFLKNLLHKQYYQLYSHYAGMPCSTASVQAELFYGVKSAVPAFSFYNYKSNRIFTMYNPKDALEIEHRLENHGKPLLSGGSAYSDIYTGGAEESHFCISHLGMSGIFKKGKPWPFFVLAFLHFYSLVRTLILLLIEAVLAVFDFFRGMIKGRDLWKEFKFVPSRVVMCVLLRELIVIGTKIDIARGMPIIHLNLMGYHEQSHRRGATSRFAHWTLRGIDDAIKRIWIAAHRSAAREYDVWVYSDHGQIDTVPYEKKFDKSIQQSITETLDKLHFSPERETISKRLGFLARAGMRRSKFFTEIFPSDINQDPDNPIITALGPMGHIYLKNKLEPQQIERFACDLIKHAHVPMVFSTNKNEHDKKIEAWTENGHFNLPEQANEIFDTKAPFAEEMVQDFLHACKKENCGDILISGWPDKDKQCYSFAIENGSHGGITTEETKGFAFLPRHTLITGSEKGYLRPLDLRTNAFKLLEGYHERFDNKFIQSSCRKNTLRVMTYNVHGCVGMDGRLSSSRIAEVISQYQPDIVALQELDLGRQRSGKEDQAMLIANHLNMDHHFHASIQLAEESFGDAVLSSYPMQLIKKDSLLKHPNYSFMEPRGALWVEVNFNSQAIQIINTHLGLNSKERLLHAKELIDTKWLSHPECKGAVILCGDFNALPSSRVFKVFNSSLSSVQTKKGELKYKGTWFGRHPVACLDHIFISPNIEVVKVEVCDSHLARLASDHRPFLAEIKICGTN